MSDPQPSLQHHEIKRTLWQRWLAWNGSFFIVSLLVHIILIALAGLLVVQVIEGNKKKLHFTAAPPVPAAAVHEVKHSKKTEAAAPAVTKRITSTALNTSVALPPMDLNASHSTDIMASVMSGLGGAGLGAGAGTGVGEIASMPLTGLTAFGFKGNSGGNGLVGYIYDFKHTKDRQPTNIKDDGILKNPHLLDSIGGGYKQLRAFWDICGDNSKYGKRADLLTESVQNQAAVMNEFMDKDWDQSVLDRYYRSKNSLTAYQIFIPAASSKDALKAFDVENEIKPAHFVILYKGSVIAPEDMEFRFRIITRGLVLMRFDNQNVFGGGGGVLGGLYKTASHFKFINTDPKTKGRPYHWYSVPTKWITVQEGRKYPMEILMENSAEFFQAQLYIEERKPEKPYEKAYIYELYPEDSPSYKFPVFALRKGLPLPVFHKEAELKAKDVIDHSKPDPDEPDPEGRRPRANPFMEYAQNPMIFPGTK
jgi:hypothetical protein